MFIVCVHPVLLGYLVSSVFSVSNFLNRSIRLRSSRTAAIKTSGLAAPCCAARTESYGCVCRFNALAGGRAGRTADQPSSEPGPCHSQGRAVAAIIGAGSVSQPDPSCRSHHRSRVRVTARPELPQPSSEPGPCHSQGRAATAIIGAGSVSQSG